VNIGQAPVTFTLYLYDTLTTANPVPVAVMFTVRVRLGSCTNRENHTHSVISGNAAIVRRTTHLDQLQHHRVVFDHLELGLSVPHVRERGGQLQRPRGDALGHLGERVQRDHRVLKTSSSVNGSCGGGGS